MFVFSLVEFSKRVQNEISAKVMPKPQNFMADFADHADEKLTMFVKLEAAIRFV
jgi:hypothetical protein